MTAEDAIHEAELILREGAADIEFNAAMAEDLGYVEPPCGACGRKHNYFGDCPRCGTNDGCLNYSKAHYSVCHSCRVYWPIGENLFSSWQYETEEDWERNKLQLSTYERVQPSHGCPAYKASLGWRDA